MNITQFPRKLRKIPSIPQIKKFYKGNILKYKLYGFLGFPGGSVGKEPTCNAGDIGDIGSIPGLGRFPWRRPWQPTPVFLPGEYHGQRSLVGYSLHGCKESDTTEVT